MTNQTNITNSPDDQYNGLLGGGVEFEQGGLKMEDYGFLDREGVGIATIYTRTGKEFL